MIEVKLQFATAEELVAFFAHRGAPSAAAIVTTPETKPEEQPGKKPETKPETKAAAATEPAATPATAAADDAQGAKGPSSELDFDRDIQPPFLELFKAKGREAAVAIVKQFGFKAKISEATPDQYPELLAAIKKAAAQEA